MRNLFFLALVLVAAFLAGWFTIDRQGDRTLIEINRNEIRSDARQAFDRGRELLERVEQPGDGTRPGDGTSEQVWDQQFYPPPTGDTSDDEWNQQQYPDQIARQPEWPPLQESGYRP